MKLKSVCIFFCVSFLLLSCNKEKEVDPFFVASQSIGFLTDSTQVKDLKHLFINDSITRYIGGDEFLGDINDIEIFEKGGKLLLALTPKEDLDSTSTIKSIRIVDSRYKTSKGITTNSTFADLKNNYTISSVQNTLRNLIVSINDINAYFTIDKAQLPVSLQNDMNLKITTDQIPDHAKVKNFYMQWF